MRVHYASKPTEICFSRQTGVSAFAHIKTADLVPRAEVLHTSTKREIGVAADEAEQRTVLKLLKILHLQITRNLEENISFLYPQRIFRVIQGRQI